MISVIINTNTIKIITVVKQQTKNTILIFTRKMLKFYTFFFMTLSSGFSY